MNFSSVGIIITMGLQFYMAIRPNDENAMMKLAQSKHTTVLYLNISFNCAEIIHDKGTANHSYLPTGLSLKVPAPIGK
jgi:hypothetical protein